MGLKQFDIGCNAFTFDDGAQLELQGCEVNLRRIDANGRRQWFVSGPRMPTLWPRTIFVEGDAREVCVEKLIRAKVPFVKDKVGARPAASVPVPYKPS